MAQATEEHERLRLPDDDPGLVTAAKIVATVDASSSWRTPCASLPSAHGRVAIIAEKATSTWP